MLRDRANNGRIYGTGLKGCIGKMSETKRLRYYDLLRIISFLMVTFYHMMVQLQVVGVCTAEEVTPFFLTKNIHIATLAVSVFFMLSGAGLTIRAEKSLSLKEYYKSRFLRLLVPFYITTVLFYIANLIVRHRMPVEFDQKIHPAKYIFTLLGMDEWIRMHQIPTFSTSIGEWFLGVLIILSILFPLFYFFMKRWPKIFLALCMAAYIYLIYNYRSSVVIQASLPIKGFEFILGMYLGKYYKKIPSKWVILAVPVTVFFFTSSVTLNINIALVTTISALAFFAAFSGLEPLLQKPKKDILKFLGAYTYPFFLVHHIIIYELTERFVPYYNGIGSVLLLFLIEIALMVVACIAVKKLTDLVLWLISLPGKKKKKEKKE